MSQGRSGLEMRQIGAWLAKSWTDIGCLMVIVDVVVVVVVSLALRQIPKHLEGPTVQRSLRPVRQSEVRRCHDRDQRTGTRPRTG